MSFVRPRSNTLLSPDAKRELIRAYYRDYRDWAGKDPKVLNRKIDRQAFAGLTERIGEIVLEAAVEMADHSGPVNQFLADNPLPPSLSGLLPDDFRAYALALNALKQWVAAEQAAMDRYLLGGTARDQCRAAADVCILSGEHLRDCTVELHHPVRDGRLPLPISKQAHAKLEGQATGSTDPIRNTLLEIKRRGRHSWVQLRRACQELTGIPVQFSTKQIRASSLSFARAAAEATSRSFSEILAWLEENDLGSSGE
jgi:hypothetical protein